MSRGFDPVFAFPTLSHNLLTAPSDPLPPRNPFRTPPVPPRRTSIAPCVKLVQFSAHGDAFCIKITHGGIEMRSGRRRQTKTHSAFSALSA